MTSRAARWRLSGRRRARSIASHRHVFGNPVDAAQARLGERIVAARVRRHWNDFEFRVTKTTGQRDGGLGWAE